MSGFDDNSYSYTAHQRMLRETWGMDDATLGRYTRGMLAGMMGFPADNLNEVAMKGWELGAAGRKKSESLRQKKIESGKKSAEARAEKAGGAQPQNQHRSEEITENAERRSNVVRENDGDFSNVGRKEGRKEGIGAKAPKQASLSAPSVNPAREQNFSPEAQGQVDVKRLSPTKEPTEAEFLAYAAHRWPEWHTDAVVSIYRSWHKGRWEAQGEKIANWIALLAVFRLRADPAHLGPRYDMGTFAQEHLPELAERMRA